MAIQFIKAGVFPLGMAPSGEHGALQVVELCGRTAYKSEDKITEDSARAFVLMLKKHHHLSVLEHSNIVLKLEVEPRSTASPGQSASFQEIASALGSCLKERNAYHRMVSLGDGASSGFAVSGSFRAWLETLECLQAADPALYRLFSRALSRFFPSLFEADDPASLPYKVSLVGEAEQLALLKANPRSDLPVFIFKFVCDRGITHEVVRHRVLSFTQESTRYVNYKSKGMTLILPEELYGCYEETTGTLSQSDPLAELWTRRAETLFAWYQEDLGRGSRPEIARDILPNLLKSEILVSGRWSGWKHFIALRDSAQAHPRIRSIAKAVRTYFDSVGIPGDVP